MRRDDEIRAQVMAIHDWHVSPMADHQTLQTGTRAIGGPVSSVAD